MDTWGNEVLLWSTKDTCPFFSDFLVLALTAGRHQQQQCPLCPASLLESIFPFLALIFSCRPEGRSMLQLPESYISVNKDIFLLFFQQRLSESQSINRSRSTFLWGPETFTIWRVLFKYTKPASFNIFYQVIWPWDTLWEPFAAIGKEPLPGRSLELPL